MEKKQICFIFTIEKLKNYLQHRTKLIACFLLAYENPRGFSLSVIIY
jgi:hypothetical protein